MLSFEDGFAKIMSLASKVGAVTIPIEHAAGRVLRQDVIAVRPQPPFSNSAMDGYALVGECDAYELVGEVAAGAGEFLELENGQAVRIFTGAPIPKGADRILIQENVLVSGSQVKCKKTPKTGDHIRLLGQDFDTNFTLNKGQILTPETIALIASMNCHEVSVHREIRVAIISTGSELVSPEQKAMPHQIIASNAYGIASLLSKWGAKADILPIIKDDLEAITKTLRTTSDYDIVITTGGASIGDYDFVPQAAKNAGFEIDLHKIALRPGKPVFAGKRDNTVLLGLPGNPVSSMITARLFLKGIIQKFKGMEATLPTFYTATLSADISANGDRTHFMRAKISTQNGHFFASPMKYQDSAMLSTLSCSNGLIVRNPHQSEQSVGDRCQFMWLD